MHISGECLRPAGAPGWTSQRAYRISKSRIGTMNPRSRQCELADLPPRRFLPFRNGDYEGLVRAKNITLLVCRYRGLYRISRYGFRIQPSAVGFLAT